SEVSAGGGPDMFLAPNDSLGDQVRKNLLLPLDDKLAGKLTNISPTAVEGMKVDGKLYAVPESFKAVALYYNTEKVTAPPATTDDLLTAVKGGQTLVINQGIYHNFGFIQSFGGKLFDANNKCAAATGGPEALQYLLDLKGAGATFVTDGGQQDTLFKEGTAFMTVNGPWALGDYRKALGDKLGVAPMPAGPGGKSGPLTGVDGFYVNVNSANPDGAVALALFLTSTDSQTLYTEKAGHVPADITVKIADKNVQGFADASSTGVPRPQSKELSNFWAPFGDALTKSMEGAASPKDAIAEACGLMDTANGK
ncbi:MAG TPA: extracellular solute-binding protein, partial [Herpetosiphonaceae bacterium]